jgi:F-type H+-transporting ATPase subunit b
MRKFFVPTLLLALICLALVFAFDSASIAAEGEDNLAFEEGGGHGHFTGYTKDLWEDFGKRVLNFAAFAFILWFLLRKPVREYFRGRKENIARTLEYLETQAANLEEQNEVMRKKLSQLSVEKESIMAQYESEGARERDRIIAEAHKTAEIIAQKAKVAADQEIKSAKRRLANETGLLAAKIARDVLIKNITEEDKSNLTVDFVDQLVKLPARK